MALREVYIQEVTRKERTSAKTNKPYISIGIKVDGKWINGFGGKWNETWKQGDRVSIEITKKEHEGKTYFNFEKPDMEKVLLDRISALEARVSALEKPSVSAAHDDEPPFFDDETPF